MSDPAAAKDIGFVTEGADFAEGDLQTAVSLVSAQLSRDLRLVGGQLATIESGHRAVLERLQSIAEGADERARRQFGSLQGHVEDARARVLGAREDLEDIFLEQAQVIQAQCETTRQQLRAVEQQCNETDRQLHLVEARLRATEAMHEPMEQRLRAAEQKNLDNEQNWHRADDGLESTRNQLDSFDQQLQATMRQLRDIQKQLADAVIRIKSFEPDIAEISKAQAAQREHAETAIAELARDIDQLRIGTVFGTSRRRQWATVAACVVAVLLVVYVVLGQPGLAASALGDDLARSFEWISRISWGPSR